MSPLHGRADRAARFARLFGTASLLAIAQTIAANAQAQQVAATAESMVPEQVLITGSLIRGAVAVGAPVTSLGAQDFAEAGAVSVGDLLSQTLPEFENHASSSGANAGFGNFINRLNIHNLNGVDTRTLMLIDGLKMPPQGTGAIQYDPSIIPGLALDRVDVLADGASATYGSLAVAGVVNLILKRGFDGAVAQGVIGEAGGGNFNWDLQGLYGRKWDSGDVTVSIERGISQQLKGNQRSFYTQNFTPWGLDNETPLVSSYPGVLSTPGSIGGVTFTTGAPQTTAKANTTTAALCANCFSIPTGQNGVGLTWAQIQANQGATKNSINNDLNQSIIPSDQWVSDTITLDQDITPWLQFNASGYYSNRRDQTHNPDVGATVAIPTWNPFYPVGAPAGLQVSYDFKQIPNFERASEVSDRYTLGFTIKLPDEWEGRLNYASGDEEVRRTDVSNLRLINTNNVSAALGWTIPTSPATPGFPGVPAWTKPASLPYLNLFCDPTANSCISNDLLNYIEMPNQNNSGYILHEYNAQFDGPLTDLPAGTLRAAVGADYTNEDYWINTITTGISSQIPQSSPDALSRSVWAVFGQVNIPVIGGPITLPLVEKLEVEVSARYDRYNDFGGTTNPRVSADWTIGWGLTARYSWGTNFVAPSFKALSAVLSRNFTPFNTGTTGASVIAACPTGATTAAAGSLAALLNASCTGSSTFAVGNPNFPAGIQISSSGGVDGLAGVLRPADYQIQPETSRNLALGFEWAPSDGPVAIFRGFDLQATYWNVKITNPLVGLGPTSGNGLNDPNTLFLFIPRGDPRFQTALNFAFNNPLAGPNLAAVNPNSIQWIEDGADRNEGFRNINGIDFSASYVLDLGDFGAWNTGITGTYFLHDYTELAPGEPVVDAFATRTAQGATTYVERRNQEMRYRARLGWADGPYSATLFMDYASHFYNTDTLPGASVIAPFPNLVANPQLINLVPAQYLFDVSLGYETGDMPANNYLKNITVFLTVNNIFDRNPPFGYGGAMNAFAYYAGGTGTPGGGASPIGRFWRLGITKRF
jgi:iron complex outermembrane receptor protein